MKKAAKVLIVFILVIISLFLGLRMWFIISENNIKKDIFKLVEKEEQILNEEVEKFKMTGREGLDIEKPFKLRFRNMENFTEIHYDGKGFGSATIYYGMLKGKREDIRNYFEKYNNGIDVKTDSLKFSERTIRWRSFQSKMITIISNIHIKKLVDFYDQFFL